jgi:hypothetical protein
MSLTDEFGTALTSRLKAPFLGSAIVTWLSLNWEVFFYAFFDYTPNETGMMKLVRINYEISHDWWGDFFIAISSGIIFTYLTPLFAYSVDRLKIYLRKSIKKHESFDEIRSLIDNQKKIEEGYVLQIEKLNNLIILNEKKLKIQQIFNGAWYIHIKDKGDLDGLSYPNNKIIRFVLGKEIHYYDEMQPYKLGNQSGILEINTDVNFNIQDNTIVFHIKNNNKTNRTKLQPEYEVTLQKQSNNKWEGFINNKNEITLTTEKEHTRY